MIFKIKTQTLLKSLNRISNIPGSKNSLPTNALVLLMASFDGLRLFRSTSDATISLECPCDAEEDGTAAVAFDRLESFVKLRREDEISIALKDGKLTLSAGRATANLATAEFDATERSAETDKAIEFKCSTLADYLTKCLPAMPSETDKRPACEGIIFQPANGKLGFIGADGRRFHGLLLEMEPMDSIIPREAALCISKMIAGEDKESEVTISFGENSLIAKTATMELRSAMISETPPRMAGMFDAKPPIATALIARDAFINSLQAASAFIGDNLGVNIAIDKKTVKITAENAAGNKFEDEIEIDGKKPKTSGSIQMNPGYLLDGLTASDQEKIEFNICEITCGFHHGDFTFVGAAQRKD